MCDPITSQRIPESERGDILPRYTGAAFLRFESLVYTLMGRACADYHGGFWQFYALSNGGFFMAPDRDEPMTLTWPDNYFEGQMSAEAAGIGVSLMALSFLTFSERISDATRECLADRFHELREFASAHAEANLILGFID